jgi:hypothetical protein
VGALAIGVTVVINVGNIVLRLPRQVAIDLRGIAAYAKAKLRNFLVRKLDTASCHHRIARQRDPWHAPAKRLILRPAPAATPQGLRRQVLKLRFFQGLGTIAYLARNDETNGKTGVSEFLIGHLDHLKERVAGAAIGASLDEVGDAKATPILPPSPQPIPTQPKGNQVCSPSIKSAKHATHQRTC